MGNCAFFMQCVSIVLVHTSLVLKPQNFVLLQRRKFFRKKVKIGIDNAKTPVKMVMREHPPKKTNQ